MKIGSITDSVSHFPFEGASTWPSNSAFHPSKSQRVTGLTPHADLDALVSSDEARAEFIDNISSRGLTLSALTANGNQLHPTSGKEQDQVVHDTIELASKLEVPTVVLMSGLPGAHGDSSPNWVTTPWPPENLDILDYQWNRVRSVLEGTCGIRTRQGGKAGVEACGGQLVHSTSTMLRLIEATDADVVVRTSTRRT